MTRANLPSPSPSAVSQPLSPSYDRQDWQRGYQSQPQEVDYPLTPSTGAIPPELEGTLFRNGPGLLDIQGQPIQHPFDGDGMICQFTFQQGRAHFRNRYVRTAGYVAEQAAGKILYRGIFGTQKPGGWLANIFDLKAKNIANTNIIYWGDRLLALWEGAEPHRLDPATLETLGLDNLDGLLKPGQPLTAHPRFDPGSTFTQGQPRLVTYSITSGPQQSQVVFYEFDSNGTLVAKRDHTLPGFAFLHDFALTENYYIFFQNPVTLNPLPFMLGFKGAGQCLKYHPDRPTQALVIPRDPSQPMVTLETDACFVFHHANAFEVDGKIVVDSICYDCLPAVNPDTFYLDVEFETLPPGQLWRSTLNLDTKTLERVRLNDRCVEFPSLNPSRMAKAARYYYLGATHHPQGNAPLQGILKVDLDTGHEQFHSFAPRSFVNEPLFVPHPQAQAEDEGWVLVLTYNGERHASDLVILDGQTLNPLATLALDHHIPYGLHGSFVPQVFRPLA